MTEDEVCSITTCNQPAATGYIRCCLWIIGLLAITTRSTTAGAPMQAEPKTWGLSDTPEPKVHWGPGGKYAFIECVITDPPPSKGRTVNVLIEGEMIAQLLLEMRSLAIKQRSDTSGHNGGPS